MGATIAVYDLLARLLAQGHRVDVLDVWSATPPEEIETMGIALGDVPRDHFRFFEGVRFELSA
ncbi:hypothetical protein EON79_11200 [bacterium]|nr:MAG: hypothetical protein EON79_11200 [bacterium]